MTAWVCGEALIDIFGDNHVVGGGPANTARALALLGHEVEFIGGISKDEHGQSIRRTFEAENVGLLKVQTNEMPTCTATVTLEGNGSASYKFAIDGTVTFDFNAQWLPRPSITTPSLLYIGSLATLIEPGASHLFEWARNVARFAPIIFDPNVRPLVESDRNIYRDHIERWLDISTIVKVSDEDLTWLYPDETCEEVGKRWVFQGVPLVVITHGANGMTAISSRGLSSVAGIKVDVVDTVGAGDTVGAVLSEALLENRIDELEGERLNNILHCASVAAAITCSRAGARPPSKSELLAALEKSK